MFPKPASAPPIAARRPHAATHHGVTIEDPWAWLRDPGYPVVADAEILAHLDAENTYHEAAMAPLKGLVGTIFEEFKGRVKQDDASVPVKDGAHEYRWRFQPGAQYRQWLRRPLAGGDEAIILDEPAMAAGHDYFRLGGSSVSPDGRLLAYAVDTAGDERFVLKVRDIASGADVATVTDKSVGVPVWTADSGALAWTEVNDNWRRFRIRLHRLGSAGDDATLYEEVLDKGFGVSVGRSTDRHWLIIAASDHVTSEVRLVPTADPGAAPLLVRARHGGVSYDVDVRGDTLFIRSNDTHENFRLVTASVAAPSDWHELVAPSDLDYLRGHVAFASYVAINGRRGGLDQVWLLGLDGARTAVAFPEAAYSAGIGSNAEPDAPLLRLHYSSMVTPTTVFDYDVAAARLVTRKVQEVPSGYDPGLYATERLVVTARDGVQVPVSIVYRRGFLRDGSGPLHLYGYGAYGIAIPPSFSANRLSLLDRGIAYAIAHIRGGDDLGYGWYLAGKLERRTNSFTDFVDVANALIAAGWARAGGISASGGSAGGELMGAVVNSDPALWASIVADVPFVDVLNTMLDDSLPLTPGEWPEWGNPISDAAAFALINSYCPYQNVRPQAYPPLLVTAGLNDPRVTYWEPAKWAAKLRAHKTDDNILLMKTNMGAGHGGKSGRFAALEELAEEYAFLLAGFGLAGPDAAAG
jgi:oligopeptidase B